MKIDFPITKDSQAHHYCFVCHQEGTTVLNREGKREYQCHTCGRISERVISFDPKNVWWIDKVTREYWHESAGMFVVRDKKIMLIERLIYPWGYTVAAGHVEVGEEPMAAAKRELWEETGIKAELLTELKTVDIDRDSCGSGADCHRWHAYVYKFDGSQEIKIDHNEGGDFCWLTLQKALEKNLVASVRFILERYGEEIIS